jgi:hypothetical protein
LRQLATPMTNDGEDEDRVGSQAKDYRQKNFDGFISLLVFEKSNEERDRKACGALALIVPSRIFDATAPPLLYMSHF